MKIHLSGPSITQKEIDYVIDAVTNSWYGNADKYNKLFEKSFADYTGMKYAIALPSCTSAIHLALSAIKISRGDEVIVPDITWIGSSAPITYVNAIPVFSDIDENTWCMSADSFENLINSNTRAIIPVDLYGNVPDMDKIYDVAKDHDIIIIEDAAEAIGSEYKNRKAGSLGDIGVFSFHGSKTLTTGEGGMLVTNDKKIYDRCLLLRNHGRIVEKSKSFWNVEIAYKYRMSDMQAALGLAQLERIDELVSRKRQIFKWYKDELDNLIKSDIIKINYESSYVKNTYWMVTIIIDSKININKETIIELMKDKNIDCRPFFYPLSMMPAYNHLDNIEKYRQNNIISYDISSRGINLPSGMDMDKEKVVYVCNNLKSILEELCQKNQHNIEKNNIEKK